MVIDSTIDSLRGVSYNVIIHYYVNFSPLLPSMITQWMKKVFHLQNGNVSNTVIIIIIITVLQSKRAKLFNLYFIMSKSKHIVIGY